MYFDVRFIMVKNKYLDRNLFVDSVLAMDSVNKIKPPICSFLFFFFCGIFLSNSSFYYYQIFIGKRHSYEFAKY